MKEISLKKLMELYVDTLSKCGTYLLSEDDKVVEYNIFEEFDIGIISFFHIDNLQRLNDAGLISIDLVYRSSTLRELVMELQRSEEWNINAVRNSPKWMNVLDLADEIKKCLDDFKNNYSPY